MSEPARAEGSETEPELESGTRGVVRGDRVQVAAFDFDGTLTHGGSVWQFLVTVAGARRVGVSAIPLLAKLVRAALFGGRAADDAKEALFRRTLRGLSIDEVAPVAANFGRSHYVRRARADVRRRLEWHRARGDRLVVVSASPELYVRAAAQSLGVDDVVATRLEVDHAGLLTGGYDGENCRGAQKLVRIEEWMRASGISPYVGEGYDAPSVVASSVGPFLWAYGNSAGDLPLLEAADVGVDAGRLGRFGKLREFRRLSELAS